MELTWYDGGKKPPRCEEGTFPSWSEGVLFVGAEGMLFSHFGRYELHPRQKFAGFEAPLAETVLLGTVAYRTGQKLEWDAENLKVSNCPDLVHDVGKESGARNLRSRIGTTEDTEYTEMSK